MIIITIDRFFVEFHFMPWFLKLDSFYKQYFKLQMLGFKVFTVCDIIFFGTLYSLSKPLQLQAN
jgi:hypothetical protein